MKSRRTNYDPKIIEELKKLPNPIHDKKYNWHIYFMNDRARSNQTRFEHIAMRHHGLTVKDIKSIPEALATLHSLKAERGRKETLNYYLPRKGTKKKYIKICVKVFDWKTRSVQVKTIVITDKLK